MAVFFLFRLKVFRSSQNSLFGEGVTRREFIEKLLQKKPSLDVHKGYIWHIGNISEIDDEGLLFAAGKTTISGKEKYDEKSGDFLEIYDEESPFTYAIYDKKLGVLAITPRSKLAANPRSIVRNIEKIMNSDSYTKDNEVRIEIEEIPDPDDFIKQLYAAYAVVGFQMEFSEPNPFDVERDFHKPMESLLGAAGGDKGVTKIAGEDLNRDTLEKLSRSVASVGNDVSARIRWNKGEKPVTKHLKGDLASFQVENPEAPILEQAKQILDMLRATYNRIRRAID
ncbi:hypothetical protein HAP93_03195 [Acidithiobacillus ferriphilus]|uniref:hypothetical protein n=1 Tax=Acidithiobacillus ferriphilus TaxID=1689834 RepID=UPI001C0606D9|nr:hypothetical protein [Acidithiobacillus ferriphilus]MBU2784782.1 hypothetical protein [Acidithiobacillus ferriphilus]